MADNFEANEPCCCCGLEVEGMVCYHHIYTRKAHMELQHVSWNKIPVCLFHHNEFHSHGNSHMIDKYKGAKRWFENNGWYKDLGKWHHNMETKKPNLLDA